MFTETIYVIRVTMADGSSHDLLRFASERAAIETARQWRSLPIGFESADVVEQQIVGTFPRALTVAA